MASVPGAGGRVGNHPTPPPGFKGRGGGGGGVGGKWGVGGENR
jgi:hypothetical protein